MVYLSVSLRKKYFVSETRKLNFSIAVQTQAMQSTKQINNGKSSIYIYIKTNKEEKNQYQKTISILTELHYKCIYIYVYIFMLL